MEIYAFLFLLLWNIILLLAILVGIRHNHTQVKEITRLGLKIAHLEASLDMVLQEQAHQTKLIIAILENS
jgi:hypothetical protein